MLKWIVGIATLIVVIAAVACDYEGRVVREDGVRMSAEEYRCGEAQSVLRKHAARVLDEDYVYVGACTGEREVSDGLWKIGVNVSPPADTVCEVTINYATQRSSFNRYDCQSLRQD